MRSCSALVFTQVSLTSLSLAYADMITQEGIEALVGLRALVTLDVTGCKVDKQLFLCYSSGATWMVP